MSDSVRVKNNDLTILTVREVADYLRMSEAKVYKLAKEIGATAWYLFMIVPTGRGEEIIPQPDPLKPLKVPRKRSPQV